MPGNRGQYQPKGIYGKTQENARLPDPKVARDSCVILQGPAPFPWGAASPQCSLAAGEVGRY